MNDRRWSRRAARLALALVACVAATSCAGAGADAARPYTSVTELYELLGGESWCGTELRLTYEDAIGSCGPEDGRILLSTAYLDRATLLDGVQNAVGEPLLLLLPPDTSTDDPWFDVRASQRSLLEVPQTTIGGVILDGDDEIRSWLDRNTD